MKLHGGVYAQGNEGALGDVWPCDLRCCACWAQGARPMPASKQLPCPCVLQQRLGSNGLNLWEQLFLILIVGHGLQATDTELSSACFASQLQADNEQTLFCTMNGVASCLSVLHSISMLHALQGSRKPLSS